MAHVTTVQAVNGIAECQMYNSPAYNHRLFLMNDPDRRKCQRGVKSGSCVVLCYRCDSFGLKVTTHLLVMMFM